MKEAYQLTGNLASWSQTRNISLRSNSVVREWGYTQCFLVMQTDFAGFL